MELTSINRYRSRVLRETAENSGACLTGFADLSSLGLPIMQKYPFSICFAVRHDDNTIDRLPDDGPWNEMSSSLMEKAGLIYEKMQKLLETWGYHYTRIPSTTPIDQLPIPGEELPQKMLATLSGLGWVGKSSLLVSPGHGPRIRLGTLLTDMILETGTPVLQSECGDCTACVDVCPTGAIKGTLWTQATPRSELLDVERCYTHLWRNKASLGRRQICGLCLKVCPIGKRYTG